MSEDTSGPTASSLLGSGRSDPPQRYVNYERYRLHGGRVRLPEFLSRHLAADPANAADMARFHFFCLAYDTIVKEGLTGDIAELGVYKGGTAALLAIFARELGRTAWLFDTFEGFHPGDLTGSDHFSPTSFSDTSLEAVREIVGDENVHYVKGRFPDSAANAPADASFCFVHLDCDLYAPMRDALNFFYPRLCPGGFMVIHDYSSLAWPGPEKAVDEFLADKTECVVPMVDSAGTCVFRKSRDPRSESRWQMTAAAALVGSEWINAGRNALAPILEFGWGTPEDWGVWGVGSVHTLQIAINARDAREFCFNADCSAALLGPRTEQEIRVSIAGQELAAWRFTHERNRAERGVIIPAHFFTSLDALGSRLILEFHPRFSEPPNELDPGNKDNRRLGLALHGVQLKMA